MSPLVCADCGVDVATAGSCIDGVLLCLEHARERRVRQLSIFEVVS